MSDKIYKCKKCSAEFTDLKEFRAHNLKCKPVENLVEPVDNSKPEVLDTPTEEENQRITTTEQARKINTCRGYYEGRKDEICKMYNKCSDCWNDFKG